MIARHGPSQNGDEAGALFRARERERDWGVGSEEGGGVEGAETGEGFFICDS